MKRAPLVLLIVPMATQLMGCVAGVSGVSPSGTGGTIDLGGGAGTGPTNGATDGGFASGGAATLPPLGTGGGTSTGSTASSTGTGGAGSGGRSGSGGTSAVLGGGMTGGATVGGTAGGTAACTTDAVPALVQAMLNGKCIACHGSTVIAGAPSLRTVADLTGPSRTDPTKTAAAMMLTRIQSTATPMPPAGGTPASAAEIAALRDWVSAGYKTLCPVPPAGGTGTGAGATGAGAGAGTGGAPGMVLPPPTGPDPFAVGATCTSKTTAGGGESATMAPGQACINCHRSGGGDESQAPIFTIAGTLYPTGHEPNNCNGMNGSSGARIVITGADGVVLTLAPNSAGNFTSLAPVRTPFRAKVTYQGRERLMIATQTSGDCNGCHTQNGANLAPGRIVLP